MKEAPLHEPTHPGLPVFILLLQVGSDGLQGFLWTHRQRIWQENAEYKPTVIKHTHTHTHTVIAEKIMQTCKVNLELTNRPNNYSLEEVCCLSIKRNVSD